MQGLISHMFTFTQLLLPSENNINGSTVSYSPKQCFDIEIYLTLLLQFLSCNQITNNTETRITDADKLAVFYIIITFFFTTTSIHCILCFTHSTELSFTFSTSKTFKAIAREAFWLFAEVYSTVARV